MFLDVDKNLLDILFSFFYGLRIAMTGYIKYKIAMLLLTIIGLILAIMLSKPRAVSDSPKGIKGWLLMLICFLGLSIVKPLYLVLEFIYEHNYYFTGASALKELTQIQIAWLTISLTHITLSALLLYWALRKKTYYPWCQIVVISMNLLGFLLITIISKKPLEELIGWTISCSVLVMYLMRSKRVKNTFIY